MDENNLEKNFEKIRNRLQSIGWDVKQGAFSKDKIPYYKKLLQEYEETKKKVKRLR